METNVDVSKPETCIVVEVFEYAGTPEEAEQAMRDSHAHEETRTFVYAAPTLRKLAHPTQINEISQYFEEKGLAD